MSVEVLYDPESEKAVLICNTSDVAFGPVFTEIDKHHEWNAQQVAEGFLVWCPVDPRVLEADVLANAVAKFMTAKPRPCDWWRCKKVAAQIDFHGHPNKAHTSDFAFCSEECRDAASEDADERNRDAYYGASTPQTQAERYDAAAAEKRRS